MSAEEWRRPTRSSRHDGAYSSLCVQACLSSPERKKVSSTRRTRSARSCVITPTAFDVGARVISTTRRCSSSAAPRPSPPCSRRRRASGSRSVRPARTPRHGRRTFLDAAAAVAAPIVADHRAVGGDLGRGGDARQLPGPNGGGTRTRLTVARPWPWRSKHTQAPGSDDCGVVLTRANRPLPPRSGWIGSTCRRGARWARRRRRRHHLLTERRASAMRACARASRARARGWSLMWVAAAARTVGVAPEMAAPPEGGGGGMSGGGTRRPRLASSVVAPPRGVFDADGEAQRGGGEVGVARASTPPRGPSGDGPASSPRRRS